MDSLMAACNKFAQIPLKRFDDLDHGIYHIKNIRRVKTKFGERLIVHADDFEIFLPPRFAHEVNYEKIAEDLANDEFLLIYSGRELTETKNILKICIKKAKDVVRRM